MCQTNTPAFEFKKGRNNDKCQVVPGVQFIDAFIVYLIQNISSCFVPE